MRRRIVLGALAVGLAWLYVKVLIFTIGVALAQAPPPWWGPLFTIHVIAVSAWVVICHTTAVLIVALPFAYLIARLYGRAGVLLALGLTIALYAFDPLPAVLTYFHTFSTHTKIITLFDAVKLLGILPGLVWVFGRLPSNQRVWTPPSSRR
jgi:fucose permease